MRRVTHPVRLWTTDSRSSKICHRSLWLDIYKACQPSALVVRQLTNLTKTKETDRFAYILYSFYHTELPALNYYNPLLNNPSSSEYIASVRSSIRSIDQIASAQFHPRTISMRDSIPPTTTATNVPSAFQLWGQNSSVKNLECHPTNDAKKTNNKSVTFSSNFTLIGKSCWAFCISVWTVLLLGAAAGAALYFAGI